jgi:hypothetical protein
MGAGAALGAAAGGMAARHEQKRAMENDGMQNNGMGNNGMGGGMVCTRCLSLSHTCHAASAALLQCSTCLATLVASSSCVGVRPSRQRSAYIAWWQCTWAPCNWQLSPGGFPMQVGGSSGYDNGQSGVMQQQQQQQPGGMGMGGGMMPQGGQQGGMMPQGSQQGVMSGA